MRMQTVKSEADLPNIGVKISLQVTDNNIEAVIIGEDENQIRIIKSDSYGSNLKVSRPQSKSTKDVWVVAGKLLGITEYRSEEFDDEYKAQSHLSDLSKQHGYHELGLSVTKEVVEYYEDKI